MRVRGALSCRPQSGRSPAFSTLSRSAQALLEPQREAPALSQREREKIGNVGATAAAAQGRPKQGQPPRGAGSYTQ